MLRFALATVVVTCCFSFQFSRATPNDAVASRFLKVEQDVLSLKQLSSSQEKKYAALLSNILSRLSSNSGDVINLRTELEALRDQHNSTVSELNTVREDLARTLNDLSRLKAQHQTCMTGLGYLKQQMNQTKDDLDNTDARLSKTLSDMSQLQTQNQACMTGLGYLKQQMNQTKDDLDNTDVRLSKTLSDMSQLQAQHQTCMTGLGYLKQQMNQTKGDLDNTDINLLHLQKKYNATARDLEYVKSGVNGTFISLLISTVNNISNEVLPRFEDELSEMKISVNVTKSNLQTATSDLAKNTVSIRNVHSLTTNLTADYRKLKTDVSQSKCNVISTVSQLKMLATRLNRVESECLTTNFTVDVTKLTADVSESKCQLKKLTTRLHRMEYVSQNTSSQITGLQQTVARVDLQVLSQGKEVAGNSNRTRRLGSRLTAAITGRHGIKWQIELANSKLANLTTATKGLLHTNVHFTLSQNHDLHIHRNDGETVKFDNLINNAGAGYNSTIGKFSAPVTGTYIFYADFTIKVHTRDMNVGIVKDHKVIASSFVDSTDSHTQTNHGSVFTVIHLIRGQHVWFVVRKGQNAVIRGKNLSRYGGALLHVG